ncbi:MAG: acyloxyacyl hydrolase [Gemmatimonadaceae bacterium]
MRLFRLAARWLVLSAGLGAVFPTPALAQTVPALARNDRSIERVAGFSWFSPGGSLGGITDRRVYLTGLRSENVLGAGRRIAVAYTMELVPLAIVERTAPNTQWCRHDQWGRHLCRFNRSARVAVGAGGSPLGFKLYFNRTSRVRVHAAGSAGMLFFSSEVPVYNSRRANFTFDYGGGVEIPLRNSRAVTFSYRFQHISNAGTGAYNPGLDANVVSIGLINRPAR